MIQADRSPPARKRGRGVPPGGGSSAARSCLQVCRADRAFRSPSSMKTLDAGNWSSPSRSCIPLHIDTRCPRLRAASRRQALVAAAASLARRAPKASWLSSNWRWKGQMLFFCRNPFVALRVSAVSPVRNPLAGRPPGVLRHNRAAPARHPVLPPSRCLRGWRAGCPATPETGPAGPPASAPRQPTVAVDCADRQAGGIGQSPAASSAQPRQ